MCVLYACVHCYRLKVCSAGRNAFVAHSTTQNDRKLWVVPPRLNCSIVIRLPPHCPFDGPSAARNCSFWKPYNTIYVYIHVHILYVYMYVHEYCMHTMYIYCICIQYTWYIYFLLCIYACITVPTPWINYAFQYPWISLGLGLEVTLVATPQSPRKSSSHRNTTFGVASGSSLMNKRSHFSQWLGCGEGRGQI